MLPEHLTQQAVPVRGLRTMQAVFVVRQGTGNRESTASWWLFFDAVLFEAK